MCLGRTSHLISIQTSKKSNVPKLNYCHNTVKLGDKERFDKKEIGVKKLFTDYQPYYTINLLLDKELSPI